MNYFLVLSFGQVTSDGQTDRRTESDAYEPTVHKHRCAQKASLTQQTFALTNEALSALRIHMVEDE